MDTYHVTWDLRIVQTFPAVALEGDERVSEDGQDKVVHGGLFKFAAISSLATETRWSTNLLREEVTNVDTAVFSTDKATGNTAALDVLASIGCGVEVVARLSLRSTFVQRAVERFDLSCPKLESTGVSLTLAAKGNLWWPSG